RLVAAGDRRGGVRRVDDREGAVRTLHQPGPAGAEVATGGRAVLLLELVERTKGLVDGIGELPARGTTPVGLHRVPVEGVVPRLRGVVEHAAGRLAHDV